MTTFDTQTIQVPRFAPINVHEHNEVEAGAFVGGIVNCTIGGLLAWGAVAALGVGTPGFIVLGAIVAGFATFQLLVGVGKIFLFLASLL